jgi:hypothetical protein
MRKVRVKAREWSIDAKYKSVRRRIKRLAHKQERRKLKPKGVEEQ